MVLRLARRASELGRESFGFNVNNKNKGSFLKKIVAGGSFLARIIIYSTKPQILS